MGSAHEIFKKFVLGGLDLLHQVVKEEWEETLYLDFKRAKNDSGPMEKEDRMTLAKAISGFAASEGGVIVWGVDCRSRSKEEPDVARKLVPLSNIKKFKTDLETYTPQITDPGVSGVVHHLVHEKGDRKKGYAFTFVPPLDYPLVRATAAKEQNAFFFRAGASFLVMPTNIIADRLGRRPTPQLEFSYRFANGGSSTTTDGLGKKYYVKIVVGVSNVGRGIGRFPCLVLYENIGKPSLVHEWGLDGNGRTGLPERTQANVGGLSERKHVFAGGSDHVIHPGTTLDITCLKITTRESDTSHEGHVIKYEVHCEGGSTSGEIKISGEKFLCFKEEMRKVS